MRDRVLILLAHGSRDPAWGEPFAALAGELRQPGREDVRVAFMELSKPSLAQAASDAIADGARTIQLLPLFMAVGRHVRRDIPQLADELRAKYPHIKVELLPSLGESEHFWSGMRDIVRKMTDLTETKTSDT